MVRREDAIYNGRRALDSEDILPFCHAGKDSIVVVGGTCVDGTAHAFSDVDVFVIDYRAPKLGVVLSRRPQHRLVQFYAGERGDEGMCRAKEHTLWMPSNQSVNGDPILNYDEAYCAGAPDEAAVFATKDFLSDTEKIDVEYYGYDELRMLFRRVGADFERAKCHSIMKAEFSTALSPFDQKLVYRLANAVCIQGKDRYEALIGEFDKKEFCYTMFRDHLLQVPEVVKTIGMMYAGHYDVAHFLAKERVLRHMRAFCFLNEQTDVEWMRLPLMVERLKEPYKPLVQKYWRIMYGAAEQGEQAKHVIAASFELVDEIMTAAIPLLDGDEVFPPTSIFRDALAASDRRTYFDADSFLRRVREALVRRLFDVDAPPTSALIGAT